jgi:flagellar biosynthesis GTPase FlhF
MPHRDLIAVPVDMSFYLNKLYFWIDEFDCYHYEVERNGVPLTDVFVIEYPDYRPTPTGALTSPLSQLLDEISFNRWLQDMYGRAVQATVDPMVVLQQDIDPRWLQLQKDSGKDDMTKNGFINEAGKYKSTAAYATEDILKITGNIAGHGAAGANIPVGGAFSGGQAAGGGVLLPAPQGGGGSGGRPQIGGFEFLRSKDGPGVSLGWSADLDYVSEWGDVLKHVNMNRNAKSPEVMARAVAEAQQRLPHAKAYSVDFDPRMGRQVLKVVNSHKYIAPTLGRVPDHFIQLKAELEKLIARVLNIPIEFWGEQHNMRFKTNEELSWNTMKQTLNNLGTFVEDTANMILYEFYGAFEAFVSAEEYANSTERKRKELDGYIAEQEETHEKIRSWCSLPTGELASVVDHELHSYKGGMTAEMSVAPAAAAAITKVAVKAATTGRDEKASFFPSMPSFHPSTESVEKQQSRQQAAERVAKKAAAEAAEQEKLEKKKEKKETKKQKEKRMEKEVDEAEHQTLDKKDIKRLQQLAEAMIKEEELTELIDQTEKDLKAQQENDTTFTNLTYRLGWNEYVRDPTKAEEFYIDPKTRRGGASGAGRGGGAGASRGGGAFGGGPGGGGRGGGGPPPGQQQQQQAAGRGRPGQQQQQPQQLDINGQPMPEQQDRHRLDMGRLAAIENKIEQLARMMLQQKMSGGTEMASRKRHLDDLLSMHDVVPHVDVPDKFKEGKPSTNGAKIGDAKVQTVSGQGRANIPAKAAVEGHMVDATSLPDQYIPTPGGEGGSSREVKTTKTTVKEVKEVKEIKGGGGVGGPPAAGAAAPSKPKTKKIPKLKPAAKT